MAITTQDIKALRERTGVSVMQCKAALEEADGDTEKALVILRKKGGAVAAKKSDRALSAGVVQAYIHSSKDIGALVALSCETDFVAKNEEFVALAYDIAMHVAAANPTFKNRAAVTEEATKAAREVFEKEAQDTPRDMQEKIVSGKLDAYLREKILLEQPFIKNPDNTIQNLITVAIQKFGENIEVSDFVRFSLRD